MPFVCRRILSRRSRSVIYFTVCYTGYNFLNPPSAHHIDLEWNFVPIVRILKLYLIFPLQQTVQHPPKRNLTCFHRINFEHYGCFIFTINLKKCYLQTGLLSLVTVRTFSNREKPKFRNAAERKPKFRNAAEIIYSKWRHTTVKKIFW